MKGQTYGNKGWIEWALLTLVKNINCTRNLNAFILYILILDCTQLNKKAICGIQINMEASLSNLGKRSP